MKGMPVFEVVGVRKAKSKTSDRVGVTLYLSEKFSDYEVSSSVECFGMKFRQTFIYEDALDGVNPKVGDKLNLIYDQGFGDKAQLIGIIPVK